MIKKNLPRTPRRQAWMPVPNYTRLDWYKRLRRLSAQVGKSFKVKQS